MNVVSILRRSEHMGARQLRHFLTLVLNDPKKLVIVEKQNKPSKALIPYNFFLELLESYEDALDQGRTDPRQSWFWSEGWQKRMQRARRDHREERFRVYASAEKAIHALHRR